MRHSSIFFHFNLFATMAVDWKELERFVASWFFRNLLRLCLFVYFGEIELVHQENIPEKGPFIIVANHPNGK